MVGETHREGFVLTVCRKWHATCGTGSDELHAEKAFFWFEQLTPVWPGLRHAVRPWSSGESHLEVRCLSGTWLREMHRNPSIRVAANSDSVDWTVQTQKLVVPCSRWLVLEQG